MQLILTISDDTVLIKTTEVYCKTFIRPLRRNYRAIYGWV